MNEPTKTESATKTEPGSPEALQSIKDDMADSMRVDRVATFFQNFPTGVSLAIFNAESDGEPIKRFASKPKGAHRVADLLVKGKRLSDDGIKLLAIQHGAQDHVRFKVEECQLTSGQITPTTPPEEQTEKPKKATTKKAKSDAPKKRGRTSSYEGKFIYKILTENPRREGTHGHRSWEALKDGMTYAEYITAGGRPNDLKWDLDRESVVLKESKK